jgi:hypothetical protein
MDILEFFLEEEAFLHAVTLHRFRLFERTFDAISFALITDCPFLCITSMKVVLRITSKINSNWLMVGQSSC